MTDAAVVADSGHAPDAAPQGAVINENAPGFNSPLGSQIPPDAVAKPAEPKAPASLDDSIDRAIAKSAAKQAEPKDAKPEAKPELKADPQPRDNGKFAAKEPAKQAVADSAKPADAPKAAEPVKPSHTAEDAPSRFTDTAKAKWHAADPEIRGETLRMHKELTDGLQKYKAAAERDGTLNEFHERATKSGTTVKDALARYVGLEDKLRHDLLGGLEEIVSNASQGKFSLRDIAAHLMNQTPDQQASQQDATIRELKQELAGLKEQVGGVAQTFEEQRKQSTLTEINAFAAKPEHSRFEELAEDIAFFMQTGRAKDLPEAYQMAERLNPAPAKAPDPAASSAAQIDPPVQPDKGQKSINGAPSAGSTSPSGKKRESKSLDDALNRAFASVG